MAGRPKGVPNKNKRALQLLLEKRYPGWDPVVQLAEIAQNEANDMPVRVQAAKEVASYMHPKLKQVDMKLDEASTIEVRVVRVSGNHAAK